MQIASKVWPSLFITFSLAGSLQAEHFLTPVRKGHFFLPSRTLFFFRPDLYVQSYYRPRFRRPTYYRPSVCPSQVSAAPRVYQLSLSAPRTEIVRANTADLIFNVHPPRALVFVDGRVIGSARNFATQRDRYTLVQGRHDLRIEFPGYQSFQSEMDVVPIGHFTSTLN